MSKCMTATVHYAMDVAARSAMLYGVQRGYVIDVSSPEVWPIMQRVTAAAIEEAITDAKQAAEANMSLVAFQTFTASMSLAGIAIAKEAIKLYDAAKANAASAAHKQATAEPSLN